MKRLFFLLVVIFAAATVRAQEPKHLAFRAVPFTEVSIARSNLVKENAAIWSQRLETNRTVSIPHNFEWCEKTGRFTNFAKAAGLMDGDFEGIFFNDSDVYKLLEGTAYSLAGHPDPELEKRADRVIDWIAAAQQPDGYLMSYYALREKDRKWTNVHRHELYCCGHLIEAAVAYKRATGKDKLLNVAEKFVDHVIDVFIEKKNAKFEVPGHEEIELALVKLYELTGKEKYMKLAEHFVDVRGDQSKRGDKLHGPYCQDHEPIRRASEITGHAVRAVYLYAGVADVAAYTGDEGYILAMDRLWNDVVNKKMYITGGIGARHQGEAFGDAFELPNRTAYCETCAAIGLVFWAHRMNLLHGDAKYADVVERCIYNGVLAGIGADGKHFFYVNPLESSGNHHRQPFFDCACCPTNVVRFLPSLPGYQYVQTTWRGEHDVLAVNQYVAGEAMVPLEHGPVKIKMETDYPKSGKVKVALSSEIESDDQVQILFRIPEWTNGNYSMKQGDREFVANGKTESGRTAFREPGIDSRSRYGMYSIQVPFIRGKYTRDFTVELDFPMEPKRIVADPRVVADRGRVAIMRGPVVYCFEQVDNEVPVLRIKLAKDPEFKEEFHKDLLGGVVVLKCKNADGRELTAIPYFAWDHRKPGPMAVWVRQQGLSKTQSDWEDRAPLYRELRPEMLGDETEAEEFEPLVTASFCHGNDSTDAVVDGIEPKNSNDHSIPRMTFWDRKGTAEWIEIDFGQKRRISKNSVYWFDDTGRGACRVPKSASVSYRKDGGWTRIDAPLGIEKDRYNTIEFDAVETTGLRLDVQLQKDVSGGILEWKTE